MKAIASCRVSTPEQRSNNSLNRQEENVLVAAKELGANIPNDGWWSGDVSSKAGKNVKRRDLKEMLEYCAYHKDVKYLIVDEVDRFMRSVDELFYFEVMFRELGVKVWYASEPELNTDDITAKLLKAVTVFRAEGSNVERQYKSIHGHEKAISEGRWTFHPKPGYMKTTEAGIHVPHATEFEPFKKALLDIAHGRQSISEAMMELNNSCFTLTRAKLTSDKFKKYIVDPFYTGVIEVDKQVKRRNENAKHEAMITPRERQLIINILEDTPALHSGVRRNYNQVFPLNNLVLCAICLEADVNGRLVGCNHNNGHSGIKQKYRCRTCNKTMLREYAHNLLSDFISRLRVNEEFLETCIPALQAVWQKNQSDKIRQLERLNKQRDMLEEEKGSLIDVMAAHKDMALEIKERITRKNEAITQIDREIVRADTLETDLKEFIQFSISYIDNLKSRFWHLEPVLQQQFIELLFPSGIGLKREQKVYTPQISPIYTLESGKSDPKVASNSLMVELVGTAPTSAGLSWLAFYRFSPFWDLRQWGYKRTNIPLRQSKVLATS